MTNLPMPVDGMQVDKRMLRSALIRQRSTILASRDMAVIACAVDPEAWFAANQVSLADYLARLDRLDALCARAELDQAQGVDGDE